MPESQKMEREEKILSRYKSKKIKIVFFSSCVDKQTKTNQNKPNQSNAKSNSSSNLSNAREWKRNSPGIGTDVPKSIRGTFYREK
jgi:hypothetical protein